MKFSANFFLDVILVTSTLVGRLGNPILSTTFFRTLRKSIGSERTTIEILKITLRPISILVVALFLGTAFGPAPRLVFRFAFALRGRIFSFALVAFALFPFLALLTLGVELLFGVEGSQNNFAFFGDFSP